MPIAAAVIGGFGIAALGVWGISKLFKSFGGKTSDQPGGGEKLVDEKKDEEKKDNKDNKENEGNKEEPKVEENEENEDEEKKDEENKENKEEPKNEGPNPNLDESKNNENVNVNKMANDTLNEIFKNIIDEYSTDNINNEEKKDDKGAPKNEGPEVVEEK